MAESDGLLNRYTGNRIGGSNPPLSAKLIIKDLRITRRNLSTSNPNKFTRVAGVCSCSPVSRILNI